MKKEISVIFIFTLVLAMNLVYASTESDFLTLINNERVSLNKPVVYINENLSLAAYLHSKEMAEYGYFSHSSLDNTSFGKRIINSGYTGFNSLGENIAYASGSADANKLFEMWKNSAGHYSNMISNSFNEIGLGVYSSNQLTYYTLDMGKRFNFIPPTQTEPSQPDNITFNNSPQDVSSNSSLQNSTILFLSLEKTESISRSYKFIKLKGVLNEKSKVYYEIDGKLHSICNKCNKFKANIRTKINNTQLDITAIDSQGNKDIRIYI